MFAASTFENVPAENAYHHGDLRRALIDAALDQLADKGLAALGLRELARIVGVSSAAPYRHFKNREALLADVAIEGFARLEATLRATAADLPESEHLSAMCRAYIGFALGNRALFELMFASDLDKAAFPALRLASEDAVAPLVTAASLESRVAPFETAVGAWALVHGLAQLLVDPQWLQVGDDRTEMLIRIVTNSFVAGLRANG